MSTPTLDRAFEVLERCVAEEMVPGAVAAVGTKEGTLKRAAFGSAQITPRRRPMSEDLLFDLASVTKIVATTTLALQFLERGLLHLTQTVASILPEFGAMGKDEVTIGDLLTHTSGLSSHRRLYEETKGAEEALAAICRLPLARPPRTAVTYSDLGYMTLGFVLANAGGAPLDELARREVFEPLRMVDAMFRPGEKDRERCVATEVVPERGGAVVGIVHDENAASIGGVSGHAGLFATCRDLERFSQMWLNGGALDGARLLSPATIAAATRDQTHLPLKRGLGWVLQPNPLWVPSDLCSPSAYSHTGFTGTSLLLDPELGIFAVLLTNRVHPSRGDGSVERIRAVRSRFHNACWAALSSERAA